jgi:uncharacterized membrane protein (UPF0127 family)
MTSAAPTLAAALCAAAAAACAAPAATPQAAITFDTAVVWVREGQDSARLVVEVAETAAQHALGLADRASLERGSGMLFLFSSQRYGGDGFQMWRTRMPLDVAFVDAKGAILRVLSMEPCAETRADFCPGYYPSVEYVTALEVNRGWFAANRVGVGAVVRVER